MKVINTFNGTMPLSKYHKICPHEHVFMDMTHEAVEPKTEEERKLFYGDVRMELLGVLRRNPYIVRDNLILDNVSDAISELHYLDKHNVDLILDLSAFGLVRDMDMLQFVSRHIKPDLVLATGFFVHDVLGLEIEAMSVEEMAAFMVNEIENGIAGTSVRAGVIKTGISEVIYPVERKALLAAAIAHKKTGLPIYVHTYPWSWAGLEALELLMENGVPGRSVCICHTDVTFDYEYLTALLSRGAYLTFDNFSKEFYFPPQDGAFAGGPFATDVERVRMLARLIKDGYGKQLMLAVDLCLKASLHKYGGWGYDHIFENIVPMMQQEGFPAEDITMLVERNPLEFLAQGDEI